MWGFWGYLTVTYIRTLVVQCTSGRYWCLAAPIGLISCGTVLAFAEAFEVTLLALARHPHLTPNDIREDLRNLDVRSILSARQLFVAATITVLTVVNTFPSIDPPGLGKLGGYAPNLFSIAFVTVTVLWAFQILPKCWANEFPTEVWRKNRWLLAIIQKFVVPSKFTAPADDLFGLVVKLCHSSQLRNSPEHPMPTQIVPSLWATCDCPLCKPDGHASDYKSQGKLQQSCDCQICSTDTAPIGLLDYSPPRICDCEICTAVV